MTERELPESYVAARLRAELGLDPRVHELGLRVEVVLVDKSVLLRGTVATAERRERVEALARELLPGWEIRNEVDVACMREPELEILA